MGGSDENNFGPSHVQERVRATGGGGGGRKLVAATGQNRRALSAINQNVIGGALNKRPLSENFAAQMANKQQTKSEEIIKSVQVSNVDDPKGSSGDLDVPMFVQHTEAMLEEIDRMEFEMEEPFEDIDDCDKKNPLAVVEYIDDLYNFYRKTECTTCVPPNYMAQQYDINERMRGILIDWLIEVHYKFELMEETLYLTVNLIDRFLAVQQIARKKLQLVGITAMLLACKYEEVSVPVVEDLILISDKAYTRKEVLDMEKLMVNTLKFNLSLPTPYVFMRRFLKAAGSNKKVCCCVILLH
ncbi:hypothetical protein PTKIN_Ptkin13bG0034100 [Pterospermum kingtungense]